MDCHVRAVAAASIFAWRRLEDDALQLGRRAAAETQRGLETLLPDLAGVERTAQLVERGALLLGDLIARDLEQNQVSRAFQPVGESHIALALPGDSPTG